MESNISSNSGYLTLQPLGLTPSSTLPSFIFSLLTYCITICCNLSVFLTIICNRTLHKPMFWLLLNLPVCDVLGATAFFPQLIVSMLHQTRVISYSACVLQAYFIHSCGGASLLTLTAMAYDRYIAICYPLSYNTIMTTSKVIILTSAVWLSDLGFMGILLILFARFKICRTNIVDSYCNNPSLLKLVCEDITINDYYGRVGIFYFQGFTFLAVVFTYIKILIACSFNKQARAKALQTCVVHVIVFMLLQFMVVITLILHRMKNISSQARRILGVSILIFPPLLNPLIYGFVMKDIREKNVIYKFKKKKVSF
ncbi:olfactory receptor 4D1-like [Engraulis encrasicolus]|uniref:olfactory receptor 4D1-like n=1 Tax=Engraulis encrasicolus TaxID=184585 RepID=UPI002FD5EEB9